MQRLTLVAALGVVAFVTGPLMADGPYEGHRLVRVILDTDKELEVMRSISTDCWCEAEGIGRPLEWRVPPEAMPLLELSGIDFEVLRQNLQDSVDAERERLEQPVQGGSWYDDFKNLSAVVTRMQELAAAYPDLTEMFSIGDTIEGRDIWAMRVTAGEGDKPGVLYNATQHAREWLAPMTAMYVLEQLLEQYGQDDEVTDLIDGLEFFIIPVVNPDGFDYSWTSQRFWRKNRRNNGDGTRGVDLNRNWGYGWGGGGSSGNTNSDTYRGTSAFSEPETQALRDLYLDNPNIVASIDFHSHGEYILYPFACCSGGPQDDGEHDLLGDAMFDAIRSVHGAQYLVGPVFETLYQASGGSVDWTWADAGAISYTIELPGPGFDPPASVIRPSVEENFAAAFALAQGAFGVVYNFPNGRPDIVGSDAPTPLTVEIVPVTSGPLNTSSGRLYSRVDGGSFTQSAMPYQGSNRYQAVLPAAPCDSIIDYYVQIEAQDGDTYRSPSGAPTAYYSADVTDINIAFADDMESDPGYTVVNENLTDGAWDRGLPLGGGDRGDPATDYDGSGSAWLTDRADGNSDVDGGPTRLITPLIDLAGTSDPWLSYARWMYNDDNDADRFVAEISDDDGKSWSEIESINTSGGWGVKTVRVLDYADLTNEVRLRFSVDDNPNDSLTEAAVDAIRIFEQGCDSVYGDVDGDGFVNFNDLLLLLAAWGPCEDCPEDLNGDGFVDFADILIILSEWTG